MYDRDTPECPVLHAVKFNTILPTHLVRNLSKKRKQSCLHKRIEK